MNKPLFLRLTKDIGAATAYRDNFANVRRYYPTGTGGTQIEYIDGNITQVKESCEEIDKMLDTCFISKPTDYTTDFKPKVKNESRTTASKTN